MPKSSDIWPSITAKIEHYLDKQPDGCWVWTRALNTQGYGHMGWDGKVVRVHRAYVLALGWDIPEGMMLDHLCRNRACSNPDHLEVVTPLVNARRGIGLGKRKNPVTHCQNGHAYDEANTYMNPSGSRACKKCHVRWSQEWRERNGK